MERFFNEQGNILEQYSGTGELVRRYLGTHGQSVKNCLKKSLGNSLLNLIELQALLAEIQAVINDRPIDDLVR